MAKDKSKISVPRSDTKVSPHFLMPVADRREATKAATPPNMNIAGICCN